MRVPRVVDLSALPHQEAYHAEHHAEYHQREGQVDYDPADSLAWPHNHGGKESHDNQDDREQRG
jgi:hypothetical protein